MIDIILPLIIAASSVWVYVDSTNNKIGKIPDQSGFFNLHAGAWAVVTMVLWIVGFPAYLIKRKSLIELAKEKPIDVSNPLPKTAGLVVAGLAWVLASFPFSPSVPSCSDSATTDLVIEISKGELASQAPQLKSKIDDGSLTMVVDAIRTTDVNEKTGANTCAAGLKVSNDGEVNTLPITYSSEITDDGRLYVNVDGL
jgi:hypothetical protein